MEGIQAKRDIERCFSCKACDRNTELCHAATFFQGKPGLGVPCKTAIKTCNQKGGDIRDISPGDQKHMLSDKSLEEGAI